MQLIVVTNTRFKLIIKLLKIYSIDVCIIRIITKKQQFNYNLILYKLAE